MPTFTEGKLAFTFPDDWEVTKYDDWAFYRNQFNSCCGRNKAVDFLAYNARERTLWLIEVKDYRQFPRRKPDTLWDEMAVKARDTLAGIVAAKVNGGDPEQSYSVKAIGATQLRIVLHLEQPSTPTRLFPRAFNPADVQQKLKQIVKPIDAHPRVVELMQMAGIPWTATSLP